MKYFNEKGFIQRVILLFFHSISPLSRFRDDYLGFFIVFIEFIQRVEPKDLKIYVFTSLS